MTVRLYIHTIVFYRIDPTEKFKGSVGRPTDPDLLQNDQKKGHVNNLDLLNKKLLNKNPAKKSTIKRLIKFWQEPNA